MWKNHHIYEIHYEKNHNKIPNKTKTSGYLEIWYLKSVTKFLVLLCLYETVNFTMCSFRKLYGIQNFLGQRSDLKNSKVWIIFLKYI